MINVEFDERSVFTYDSINLSIGVWDHQKGWLSGPVIGLIGEVKFANMKQLEMFHEMLDLLIEKRKRGGVDEKTAVWDERVA